MGGILKCKVGTEWVDIPALVGPQGPQGPIGVTGPQGLKGETGNSGVHVGTNAPTDESIVVWIDITGDADLVPAEGGSY